MSVTEEMRRLESKLETARVMLAHKDELIGLLQKTIVSLDIPPKFKAGDEVECWDDNVHQWVSEFGVGIGKIITGVIDGDAKRGPGGLWIYKVLQDPYDRTAGVDGICEHLIRLNDKR